MLEVVFVFLLMTMSFLNIYLHWTANKQINLLQEQIKFTTDINIELMSTVANISNMVLAKKTDEILEKCNNELDNRK